MGELQRLDKILSNLGYGSRKDIKKDIKKGLVSVDGRLADDGKLKLDPEKSEIIYNGELVNYRKFIYLMLNKPQGLVSSTRDPLTSTVVDLLSHDYKAFDPFPAGRLDKDTEGLILLTNDGQLAHRLLSPKNYIDKKYFFHVLGNLEDNHIEEMAKGVVLDDGYKTLSADLEILTSGEVSKGYLTIREGKFHQVKRMFKSLDLEVTYLKRVSISGLELDPSLGLGEYRELTEFELSLLTRD